MCHINTHGNIQDNGDMNSLVTGLLLRQGKPFSKEKIINVLNSFKGLQKQVPPQYSAIKINGKKAYEYEHF